MDTLTPPPGSSWKAETPRPNRPITSSKLRLLVQLVIPAVILLAIAIGMITGYLEKWLWMDQLKYSGIFWKLFSVQWTMYAASFTCVFFFIWLNLRHALVIGGVPSSRGSVSRALVPHVSNADSPTLELTPHLLHSAIVIASLLIAWFAPMRSSPSGTLGCAFATAAPLVWLTRYTE